MFKYVKDLSTLNEKTLKKNIFCKQIEQSDLKKYLFYLPIYFFIYIFRCYNIYFIFPDMNLIKVSHDTPCVNWNKK